MLNMYTWFGQPLEQVVDFSGEDIFATWYQWVGYFHVTVTLTVRELPGFVQCSAKFTHPSLENEVHALQGVDAYPLVWFARPEDALLDLEKKYTIWQRHKIRQDLVMSIQSALGHLDNVLDGTKGPVTDLQTETAQAATTLIEEALDLVRKAFPE